MTLDNALADVRLTGNGAGASRPRSPSESGQPWFEEVLTSTLHQRLSIDRLIHEDHTGLQRITVFENETFGRVLALDGIVQVTDRDEFIYHEMMAHVPLVAHGEARRVLIVGGGDGGTLEEVLKHRSVERAVLVEIDSAVVEVSRRYLPEISKGAFEDPRADLIIADGAEFVGKTEERFDIIIVDSPDPHGPGEVLFGREFYRRCRDRLNPGGILVAQAGSPFFQADVPRRALMRLRSLFGDAALFNAVVPAYGGLMAFAWASDDPLKRNMSALQVASRFSASGKIDTLYYTPAVHEAAFVLPRFMQEWGREG